MKRWISVLSILLLLQCGLVTTLYWRGLTQQKADHHSLASFSGNAIDEIRIGDEFDNEVVLVKVGEYWLLEELGNLPADQDKVEALLQAIAEATHGWPVAQSSAARQRFQVADYYYQRRLKFLNGGVPQDTIYLGTSPGFRKVHARNHEQDAIHSIGFNAFDAPSISGGWLEPKLLQVRAPVAIVADSYSVSLQSGEWRSGIGGTPDERELGALLNALETLQIDGTAQQEVQRELADAEADLVLSVTNLAEEVVLELFTLEGEHYIHSSKHPLFFKISAYDFDRLTTIDFALISAQESPGTSL